MQLKRELKILGMFLTTAYSAFVFAQAQPVPNGSALGSTTGTGVDSVSATRTTTNTTPTATTGGMGTRSSTGSAVDETAPNEITTMDPMDPSRDSRMGSDATTGDRRAMGTTASGTVTPNTPANPRY